MTTAYSEEYKGYKIKAKYDDMPMEHFEYFENLGTMICFHGRYNLGNEHSFKSEDYSGWDEMIEAIEAELGEILYLPIYMYDHSGITINTTGFSCGWDSGQVGFIVVTKERAIKEYGENFDEQKVLERLKYEVELYDCYIRGDVYYFTVEDENGEVIDSCGGFYGYDFEENGLLEHARNSVDCEVNHRRKDRQNKLKTLVQNNVPLGKRGEILSSI